VAVVIISRRRNDSRRREDCKLFVVIMIHFAALMTKNDYPKLGHGMSALSAENNRQSARELGGDRSIGSNSGARTVKQGQANLVSRGARGRWWRAAMSGGNKWHSLSG